MPAQLRVGHLVVRPQKVERLAPVDEKRVFRLMLIEVALEQLVEEEGDRYVEGLGHFEKRARGDPVDALLVFLHLLRGEPDALAKLLLAEPEQGATQPDAAADLAIDMLQLFEGYLGSSLSRRPPLRRRADGAKSRNYVYIFRPSVAIVKVAELAVHFYHCEQVRCA